MEYHFRKGHRLSSFANLIFSIAAMNDPKPPERPRSRLRRRKNKAIYFLLAGIIALAIGSYFYLRQNPSAVFDFFSVQKIEVSPGENIRGVPEIKRLPAGQHQPSGERPGTTAIPGEILPQKTGGQLDPTTIPQPETADEPAAGPPGTAKDGVPSGQPAPAGQPYQQLSVELNGFYSHLDRAPYMLEFHLKEPSKAHFSKLLQKLINNPPDITRETDDLLTLLKNTAHFFRVLGKDNILILKGILDREKDSFEKILKTFYALTDYPEYLKKEYSLTLPQDNLYEYAGFFLNTIGGRLYLFRRDAASRMTISYYAILVIDKANRQGNNRLGIDLKPPIDMLIEEIESGGKGLQFREEYLDTLYDLKEHYGNRG